MILSLLSILVLLAGAFGLEDQHELENGKAFQTCAYVANYENSRLFFISQHLTPEITIQFQDVPEASIDTLIIAGQDLEQVKLDPPPAIKVCDESSIKKELCTYPSAEELDKRIPLSEFIDADKHSFPLEHYNFVPSEETDRQHVFEVKDTSIYCVVFIASNIPEDVGKISVVVDWKQSFGNLLVSDYHFLYWDFTLFLLYASLFGLFVAYLYRKVRLDKTNAVTSTNVWLRNFTLQLKLLFFIAGTSVAFLESVTVLALLNKHGYGYYSSLTVVFLDVFSLTFTAIFTVWIVYNCLVISSGFLFFSNLKDAKRYKVFRIVSAVLLLQLLLYSMEEATVFSILGGKASFLGSLIFFELVLVYFACCYYAFNTYKQLKNQSLRLKLVTTYVLLTVMSLVEFAMRIRVNYDFGNNLLLEMATNTTIVYTLNYVITVAIVLVWKDVSLQNGELLPK
ncbi:hypothetical protein OGAPHI_000845 [Ogataea philodendri]|uniref:Uncharacterized protein n=1 Tax=Ogataea philodendri TaxID=1378263 RepID=A0A9P8TA17_9ASCO|nr:uncharacterized protein OGAPHI_000845 [Ogataea philodendri]KAH3671134.1 hypothetical protein OGAPHI_000845 [Ogataea philodendri]